VNLTDRCIEVLRAPLPRQGTLRTRRIAGADDVLRPVALRAALARVGDVLP